MGLLDLLKNLRDTISKAQIEGAFNMFYSEHKTHKSIENISKIELLDSYMNKIKTESDYRHFDEKNEVLKNFNYPKCSAVGVMQITNATETDARHYDQSLDKNKAMDNLHIGYLYMFKILPSYLKSAKCEITLESIELAYHYGANSEQVKSKHLLSVVDAPFVEIERDEKDDEEEVKKLVSSWSVKKKLLVASVIIGSIFALYKNQ